MEGMSLAALDQAQSGDVPSGQARHAHIRASLIGVRGRPWVPTPRRLSVWPGAPCPGRRRPRSQHRRRFRRLIWQPVGSGPENRLHDICLRLRERTREPQRGTDPRTVNGGWLRAPSRGPRLGADPRTACMTSVCDFENRKRGTDPRTVNRGWLRVLSRGPWLGADPRTACMT
jgi:hypothetical protein